MNEHQLRVLVRQAITENGGLSVGRSGQPRQVAVERCHPSHGRCELPSGADADGPCLIEPAVMCDHCGYCLSYGH
jgi:hypothetical protein